MFKFLTLVDKFLDWFYALSVSTVVCAILFLTLFLHIMSVIL